MSKPEHRKNSTVFTVLLVSPWLLERELAFTVPDSVKWRFTSKGERHVVVLEGNEEQVRRDILSGFERKFGPLFIRHGDTDYLPDFVFSLREAGVTVVSAESCTGGLVAKLITDVPGSSDVFWGGFVTYDNRAKIEVLGVPRQILDEQGAVSLETIRAMAAGALRVSGAGSAVAVSGVAGPGGGSPEKPVGTVWIGVHLRDGLFCGGKYRFSGSRERIRTLSAYQALFMLESVVLKGECIDTDLPYEYI